MTNGLETKNLSVAQQLFIRLISDSLHSGGSTFLPSTISAELIGDLYLLSEQQHLLPMLHEALKQVLDCRETVQTAIDVREEKSAIQITHQILHDEALYQVSEAFKAETIPFVILKGLTCRAVYPEPYLRPSGDEDILIHLEDVYRCDAVLRQLGYTPDEKELLDCSTEIEKLKDLRELHYNSEEWGLLLEVHLNSIGTESVMNRQLNQYFESCMEDIHFIELNGRKYPCLAPTTQLMHVFAHFLRHFLEQGAGIRQMLDVLLTAKRYGDQIDWTIAGKMLDELSAVKLFQAMVQAGVNFFGLTFDNFPEKYMDYSADPEALLLDMFLGGVYGHEDDNRKFGSFVTKGSESSRSGLAVMKRILFPGSEVIKNRYPVVRRKPVLLPLFYIIRILQLIWEYKNPIALKRVRNGLQKGDNRRKMLQDYGLK